MNERFAKWRPPALGVICISAILIIFVGYNWRSPQQSYSFVARELRRLDAARASQGVAASPTRLYAISNTAIDGIDRANGRIVASIEDPVRYRHLNSCLIVGARLVCAHSNFPALPMQSSIELFDAATLSPIASRPIGGNEGSLTWIIPFSSGWLACFANYDGHGGTPGRDHTATILVQYTNDFGRRRLWRLPRRVLDRLAPYSASGGAQGSDHLLYVTGHDRPEAYVLSVPDRGEEMAYVATIGLPTEGQAISLDPLRPRVLWSIDRRQRQIVASVLPAIRREVDRTSLSSNRTSK